MTKLIRVLALATATVLPAAAFAQTAADKDPAAKPADQDKGAAGTGDTKGTEDTSKMKKHKAKSTDKGATDKGTMDKSTTDKNKEAAPPPATPAK